jgi:hypothetical protein
MFIVWAAFATCFVLLLVYRGNLTRYEEDQLFLSDNNRTEIELQGDIQRKVRKIEPLVRAFGGAAGLLTVGIVGLYVWQAWQRLQ